MQHRLWTEKYRPTALDQYIFKDEALKKFAKKTIEDKSIPHLLLSGVQGTGKTTLARILLKQVGVHASDILTINASDENSVQTVRQTIKDFVITFPLGEFKVVLLEEADHFSMEGQGALRNLMETYEQNARFILTCNYAHKIMPAIKSRTQHFQFKTSDVNDIAEYIVTILMNEKVKFTLDQVDKFVAAGYPDIRKVVNLVQQHTVDGVLQLPTAEDSDQEYRFKLLDLIEAGDWQAARKLLCGNVSPEDWESVYRFLYDNMHRCPKFAGYNSLWDEAIVVVADHLVKHSVSADPEINAASMLIQLSQLTARK